MANWAMLSVVLNELNTKRQRMKTRAFTLQALK
jgi:hypothetical protein